MISSSSDVSCHRLFTLQEVVPNLKSRDACAKMHTSEGLEFFCAQHFHQIWTKASVLIVSGVENYTSLCPEAPFRIISVLRHMPHPQV